MYFYCPGRTFENQCLRPQGATSPHGAAKEPHDPEEPFSVLVHLALFRVLKVFVLILVLVVVLGGVLLGGLGEVDDTAAGAAPDHVVEVDLLQVVIGGVVVICASSVSQPTTPTPPPRV